MPQRIYDKLIFLSYEYRILRLYQQTYCFIKLLLDLQGIGKEFIRWLLYSMVGLIGIMAISFGRETTMAQNTGRKIPS